jgi:tRNA threonylcarbamoyladenosine biosynthesis protein TsaB
MQDIVKSSSGGEGHLLAIETATTTARVAVLDRRGTRRAAREATAERHSSNLLRLCDEVLREAGITPAQLDAIACGAGPGSFTGLRVGLAVGKGLALPTARPFLLVSSLAALALDITRTTDTLPPGGAPPIAVPCIDAGKGQIYAGLFRADSASLVTAVGDEWVLGPEELLPALPPDALVRIAGNGADRFSGVLDAAIASRIGARRIEVAGPTAESVGRLALLRLARGEADSLESAVPAYGRQPDITKPKRT